MVYWFERGFFLVLTGMPRPALGKKNARPHTSLVTRKTLLELGWEVMPHPPYSHDLAPSDYHLFHLNGKTFDSNESVKNYLIQFFASKNQNFYESGIMKLTER